MYTLRTISCLLLIGWFQHIFGQEAKAPTSDDPVREVYDVVYLKYGSKVTGKIVSWDVGGEMEFTFASGTTVKFPPDYIVKVEQMLLIDKGSKFVRQRPYDFKSKGLYGVFDGFVHTGGSGGLGLSTALGYRYNTAFGLGGGFGYETNDVGGDISFVPVYAEIRGFILPKRISPYYALRAGYAFTVVDNRSDFESARGGLRIQPEIGVRFGAREVAFFTGMAFKYQRARFTNIWWENNFSRTDITYKRFELKAGIIF